MRVRAPLLVSLLLTACDDDFTVPTGADQDQVDRVLALTGNAGSGEAVFDEHCAACHDKSGLTATIGPALGAVFDARSDAEVVAIVLGGQGAMPAIRLDDQPTADLLAWMRETFVGAVDTDPPDTDTDTAPPDTDTDTAPPDTDPPGPDLANGEAKYGSSCAACHPASGAPGVGPGMRAIATALTSAQIEDVVRNGQGTMPAFNPASLSDPDLADILAWIDATF